MEYLILYLAQFFGVQPEVIIALLPTIVFLFNFASRLIPDDAKGFLGFVGRACAILGLHVSNRVTRGLTVNDLAQFTLDRESEVKPIQRHAPKLEQNGFSVTSQLFGLLMLSLTLTFILGGCTGQTVEKIQTVTCKNADKVRAAAETALAIVNQCPNSTVGGGIY